MTINAVIFGASGMIGRAVLLECLEDERIEKVLCIARSPIGMEHPKLESIIHRDFDTVGELADRVKGYNACFYAVGIPSTGLSEEQYQHVTCDLTLKAAEMLLQHNREMHFCFVSAAGADSSEQGRSMWARVKGRTENKLQTYPFASVYCIRPAFVQPMKGVRSKVKLYRIFYSVARPFFFFFRLFPSVTSTSVEVGRAMINAVCFGSEMVIHESRDIVRLGRMNGSGKS
jgi:NAD(P)-dependent dehydrogenase (short-subunit alcohol dehydrogenase family)